MQTPTGFFQDFLAPRLACVAVDGSLSLEFVLQNMIFQGTVLGPWLWNVYFADVHEAAARNGACERKFADDLSVSKDYARTVANEEVVGEIASFTKGHPCVGCQKSSHL